MKFVRTCFLLLLFSSLRFSFSQNLQFYREDLTFEIKDNYFYVDGVYNFNNDGDKEIKQILFYPFPTDSAYVPVDSMNALDSKSQKNVVLSTTQNGMTFNVELAPYGIGKYRISYRQKLLKNKAEYILITTQKWGHPFDNAHYKLIVPVNMKITSISYTQDSSEQTKDMVIYYWSKKDFMPNKNMVIYFER